MYIKLNQTELNKLIEVLNRKEENMAIASYLNDLCFSLDQFPSLTNDKDVKSFNLKCIDEFLDYFELDRDNEENIDIILRQLEDVFHFVDINDYEQNSYKLNVKPRESSLNGYKLHYLSYPVYSFFPLDDIRVNDKKEYLEKASIGIADKEYKYLTLSKNNNIWMCITPNEINTMLPHINKAKGNIVVFGLGLGYFAYMVSLKKEVKSITIIEKDKDIINLFNDNLFSYFPHQDKIKIINADAFKFIEKDFLSSYDYAFFDLWHNAEDGLPLYLKIKSLPIVPPSSYWIEESMICLYRRCLLTVIEESLNGYGDDDYRRSKNDIERVINDIYFKTKTKRFNNFEEINKFLSKESILELISK